MMVDTELDSLKNVRAAVAGVMYYSSVSANIHREMPKGQSVLVNGYGPQKVRHLPAAIEWNSWTLD